VRSIREGKVKEAEFSRGVLVREHRLKATDEPNGTEVFFVPDPEIFPNYRFHLDIVEQQLWNYAYLNAGLKLKLNGKLIVSKRGLYDLLEKRTDPEQIRYPIIHLRGADIEMAMTHANHYGEQYYSFVNGQHTTQGGTHLQAFKEAIVKAVRKYYNKNFDPRDVRTAIVGAISIRIEEPVFESQIVEELDNYLHRNTQTAEALLKRIQQSERERKEIAGIRKLANQRAKRASLHNKKADRSPKRATCRPKPSLASAANHSTVTDCRKKSSTKTKNLTCSNTPSISKTGWRASATIAS